jgi:hypothetical protein
MCRDVVHINCADVVLKGRQADSRFIGLYHYMQQKYRDPEFGKKVCLHEAAHAIYMGRAEHQAIRFIGPAILYNENTDEFIAIGALVDGGFVWAPASEETLFQEAKIRAAGGLAVRKLLNHDDAGDEQDRRGFLEVCRSAPPHLQNINAEEMWARAQAAVEADLDSEQLRVRIWAKTEDFMEELYRVV